MGPMLRCPEVGARMRRGRTALHVDVKAGLLPPGVKVGARAVAWPSAEIDAVLAARIAGQSETEIKALVRRLVADRRKLLATVDPGASGIDEDPAEAQTIGAGEAKPQSASLNAMAGTRRGDCT